MSAFSGAVAAAATGISINVQDVFTSGDNGATGAGSQAGYRLPTADGIPEAGGGLDSVAISYSDVSGGQFFTGAAQVEVTLVSGTFDSGSTGVVSLASGTPTWVVQRPNTQGNGTTTVVADFDFQLANGVSLGVARITFECFNFSI